MPPPSRRAPTSIVEDHGEYASTCGYCASGMKTSKAHGMVGHEVAVDDYQALIDRGWRRSGVWLYRPTLDDTCCPPYTIRLDARRFAPDKAQRRVERRFRAFLDGRDDANADANADGASGSPPRGSSDAESDATSARLERLLVRAVDACARADAPGDLALPARVAGAWRGDAAAEEDPTAMTTTRARTPRPRVRVFPSRARAALDAGATRTSAVAIQLCAFAAGPAGGGGVEVDKKPKKPPKKQRRGAEDAGLRDQGPSDARSDAAAVASAIARALESDPEFAEAGLRVAGPPGVGGYLNFSGGAPPVHERPPSNKKPTAGSEKAPPGDAAPSDPGATGARPPPTRRTFTVDTSRSSFVAEEFELWRKYQAAVHGDSEAELTRAHYTRFLVDSPLRYVPPGASVTVRARRGANRGWFPAPPPPPRHANDAKEAAPEESSDSGFVGADAAIVAPPSGFGSFHQAYRVDGALVAVGVVDVLPRCLSSVYSFYDPDLAPLALGKLTALREIRWTADARAACPSLEYYYLGFYIHGCPKMRYKAEYKPSELRCPVTGAWVPVEECRAALDARRGGFGPLRAAPETGVSPGGAEKHRGIVRVGSEGKNGGSEGENRGSEGESGGSEDSYDVLVGVVSSGGLRYVGVLPEAPEELRALQPLLREKHDAFRKATGCAGEGLACLVDADRVQASEGWGLSDPETSESEGEVGESGGESGGESASE